MKARARLCCALGLGAALGCVHQEGGVIRGVVENPRTSERLANAFVVLQCTCLPQMQERFTNERGVYSFDDLPAGNYTVQVLVGRGNEFTTVRLPKGAKSRADFLVDPEYVVHTLD